MECRHVDQELIFLMNTRGCISGHLHNYIDERIKMWKEYSGILTQEGFLQTVKWQEKRYFQKSQLGTLDPRVGILHRDKLKPFLKRKCSFSPSSLCRYQQKGLIHLGLIHLCIHYNITSYIIDPNTTNSSIRWASPLSA